MVPLAGVFLTNGGRLGRDGRLRRDLVLALGVLQLGVAEAGLQGLGQVADADVGDAARRGLAARHHARVAGLTERARGRRPRHRGVVADLRAPARRVRLGEERREEERVTAAVRAVQGHDRDVRQRHARVEAGDLRVVPRGDLALVDGREHLARQLQVGQDARDVVGHDLRRNGQRDVPQVRVGRHDRSAAGRRPTRRCRPCRSWRRRSRCPSPCPRSVSSRWSTSACSRPPTG